MNVPLDDDLWAFATGDRVRSRGFATPAEYVRHLIRRDRELDRIRLFLEVDGAAGPPPRFPRESFQRLAEMVPRWRGP